MRSYYGVRGVHYCLGAAPVVDPATVRVEIQNEAGAVQSRCTLGEFLFENPDLVVDASDILQAITQFGRWEYHGGAGGVFYLVPEPKDETAAAVDEILRAATAWYGDNVPVKWLAVMPAMRAAPAMFTALESIEGLCYEAQSDIPDEYRAKRDVKKAHGLAQAAIQAAKGGAL